MRIALLLTEAFRTRGGIQAFNRALCKAASDLVGERGGRLNVLSLNDRTEDRDERYLPRGQGVFRGLARNKRRFSLRAVRAAFRADRVVVGHVNLLPLVPVLRAAGARHVSCVLHGVEAWSRWPAGLRFGARRCTDFLCVSDFTRKTARQANGLTAPMLLFPDTLDPLWEIPAGPAAFPPEPRLLTISRLDAGDRYKGVDTTIEALPAIAARHPAIEYWIAGDGTDRPRLEALARSLGMETRIRFLGRVSDHEIRQLYARCSLFVLPSEGEGFGIVYLEAASHGKPSVGIAGGAVSEIIQDGRSGLLLSSRDAGKLAAAIDGLLSTPRLREMGEAARRDLVDRFLYPAFRARFAAIVG